MADNQMQFIQRFNDAREKMRVLLPQVDERMEIYPGWTIKDMLAHLTGWDDATILALQAFASHEPPPVIALHGIDDYNAQTVEERKELDYQQVMREWEGVRDQLIPLLNQLDEEKLQTSVVTPWGRSMPIATLLNIMIDHEEEHAEALRTRLANPHQPPQAH
jgi:hypothetical protein